MCLVNVSCFFLVRSIPKQFIENYVDILHYYKVPIKYNHYYEVQQCVREWVAIGLHRHAHKSKYVIYDLCWVKTKVISITNKNFFRVIANATMLTQFWYTYSFNENVCIYRPSFHQKRTSWNSANNLMNT